MPEPFLNTSFKAENGLLVICSDSSHATTNTGCFIADSVDLELTCEEWNNCFILLPHNPRLQLKKIFENLVVKEKIFCFPHNFFLSFKDKFYHFCNILFFVCKNFHCGPVVKDSLEIMSNHILALHSLNNETLVVLFHILIFKVDQSCNHFKSQMKFLV